MNRPVATAAAANPSSTTSRRDLIYQVKDILSSDSQKRAPGFHQWTKQRLQRYVESSGDLKAALEVIGREPRGRKKQVYL
jgi:hypothetical protein